MSTEPFLGEIKIVGFSFAPQGYLLCQGQILSIQQNNALFSLLGTTYGGNGSTTFGLPNLAGRVPIGVGNGPGLSPQSWGQVGGTESVSISLNQLPAHTHTLNINNDTAAIAASGAGAFLTAKTESGESVASSSLTAPVTASAASISPVGNNLPVGIMQPSLGLYYIIAFSGIYPARP